MKFFPSALIAACFVLSTTLPSLADAKGDQAVVKELTTQMTANFLKGDLDMILKYTHPGLAELMGGKEKLEEASKAALDQVTKDGGKLESYEVGEAMEPIVSEGRTYILLPTKLVMVIKGNRVTVHGHMLAIRKKAGDDWCFLNIDSDSATAILQKLEPDLPKELVVPEVEAPKVEKLEEEEKQDEKPAKPAPKSE